MKKNILITGSTDGIGKLAAIQLAKAGHTVFLHGRNSEKLTNVISEIQETTKNTNISGFIVDFSDLKAVKAMGEKIRNEVPKLDVLINNAGIFKSAINKTKDHLDIRFAVNYLAPYVLTKEILPLLENGRIINLSSAAQAPISLPALLGKEELNVNAAYAQSKLALTMWSFNLAKEVPNTTVIAVNPGSLLNTRMVSEAYGQFWAPAEKGANILYDLAVEEAYEAHSGEYFDNDKGNPKGTFAPAHADAYEEGLIQILLQETERLLKE